MTPDADPDYSTQHNLLTDGCAVDDTVEYHNAPSGLAQRFSFEAFRFNERPSAVVYMHCYIDVCSVSLGSEVSIPSFKVLEKYYLLLPSF